MDEFKVIETQEQFDEAIKERLNRERKKSSEATAELQKELDSYKSQLEAYQTKEQEFSNASSQIDELKKKIAEYEADSVKTKIAIECNLPLTMKDRLRGNTEDEIRADAQALIDLIPKPQAPSRSTETIVTPEEESKRELRGMLKNL